MIIAAPRVLQCNEPVDDIESLPPHTFPAAVGLAQQFMVPLQQPGAMLVSATVMLSTESTG